MCVPTRCDRTHASTRRMSRSDASSPTTCRRPRRAAWSAVRAWHRPPTARSSRKCWWKTSAQSCARRSRRNGRVRLALARECLGEMGGSAMEFVRRGRSGPEVSRRAIGTMTFGTQMDEPAAHRLLDQAYGAGVNFFDTAEIYPAPAQAETYGLSELILGRWLQRMPRDRVVISSKMAGRARTPGPPLPLVRGGATAVDRTHVSAACEGSLQRLGTDYIDIYQPHWPDRETPIETQLDALIRLVEQGKVRRIGLSNETPWGLTAFCAAACAQA